MKPIRREPIKFDVFNAYAEHTYREEVSLRAGEGVDSFVASVRTSIENSLSNKAFIFGQATQSMFEKLVMCLGRACLLKVEDAGRIYTIEDVKVPDFRIVLTDGKRLLIEVKNFSRRELAPFVMKEHVFESLVCYAKTVDCDMKIAIFWHRWNLWTLVSPEHFQKKDGRRILSLKEAMIHNEMSILGDKAIGSKFPLRFRLTTDKKPPPIVDEKGNVKFKVADIQLFCENRLITDSLEKNIAWYLMLYGNWQSDQQLEMVDARLKAVEEKYMPVEDHGHGFEIIGWLSGMFSAFYRHSILDEGDVRQLHTEVNAENLGFLIPEGYKGSALPLWIFVMESSQGTGDSDNDSET